MRASKIKDLLSCTLSKGMSNYLSNIQLTPGEIIVTSRRHANLEVALSGIFPPNPVELLWNERLEEFFVYARENYDYIIVDTPPSLTVTDSLIINRVCDASIYVTRAGITHKKMMQHADGLYCEKKLVNMAYVLKGIIAPKTGYGYGYGYGYGINDVSSIYGEKKQTRKKPRS
jgi:Mrp family chromosome partitioning ATPase